MLIETDRSAVRPSAWSMMLLLRASVEVTWSTGSSRLVHQGPVLQPPGQARRNRATASTAPVFEGMGTIRRKLFSPSLRCSNIAGHPRRDTAAVCLAACSNDSPAPRMQDMLFVVMNILATLVFFSDRGGNNSLWDALDPLFALFCLAHHVAPLPPHAPLWLIKCHCEGAAGVDTCHPTGKEHPGPCYSGSD